MIDIDDPAFMAWLRERDKEARIDLEVFWSREVKRHPYFKAQPETFGKLAPRMLLHYAAENHEYPLAKPA